MTSLLIVAIMLGSGTGLAQTPQTIDVPTGQKVVLTAEGRGVQIYKCEEGPDGVNRWSLMAPEAKLYVKDKEVGVQAFSGCKCSALAAGEGGEL